MILTVATYNILHGEYAGYEWSRLAAAIRSCGADVVGLQEVDRLTRRSGRSDGTTALAEQLGWGYHAFAPAMPFNEGEYGIALLSRYPAVRPEQRRVIPLPHRPGEEPRVCLHAVLTLPEAGDRRLHLLNTHLSFESAAGRRPQLEQIAALLADVPADEPFLLTGDFNTEDPDELAVLTGRGAWVNHLEADRPATAPHFKTFRQPPMAIDNILYDTANMTCLDSGMQTNGASDHELLWGRFKL